MICGKMPNQRQQLSHHELDKAIDIVAQALRFRAAQKGMGAMASSHEILGILSEEMQEYLDEVTANRPDGHIRELTDIAVAAIFGIASIESGGVDW